MMPSTAAAGDFSRTTRGSCWCRFWSSRRWRTYWVPEFAVASLAYLWRMKFKLKEPALVFATGAIGLLLRGV